MIASAIIKTHIGLYGCPDESYHIKGTEKNKIFSLSPRVFKGFEIFPHVHLASLGKL